MPKASLLLLALLILSTGSHAQESSSQDSFSWAKQPGYAPLFIVEGAKKNQGIGDLTFDKIEQLLPQFQHNTIRANYIRTLTEIRRGKNICAILHRTVEREKFVHFSKTIYITPSYQLYIPASKKEKLSQLTEVYNKKISFNQLLANSPGLRMAHTRGHSYGKTLDSILEQHRDKLQINQGHSGQKALIKMLLAGRVDFILEAPLLISHHLQELNTDYSNIFHINLSETPDYIPASIGCPKTPRGKTLISALNKVLPELRSYMKEQLLQWLEPDEAQAYRMAFAQYYSGSKINETATVSQQARQ